MSFLDSFFGSNNSENNESNLDWRYLTDFKDLDEAVQHSYDKPVVLFKHSTRCSISRFALKQFEREYNYNDQMELFFLDLLNYRTISNEIATRFNVQHQSPQLLVLKNGEAVYHASHSDIQAEDLKQYL